MRILRFHENDTEEVVSLFYETVHSVNARDYSREQVEAWAALEDISERINLWKRSLNENLTFVVKVNDRIVGFADLTFKGYLNRLFVHKEYQRQGIASLLVDKLEREAKGLKLQAIETESSITAKVFFTHRGYVTVRQQTVERKGVNLTNFKMRKELSATSFHE
ncbi:GNAT family N-acetyltransferase [Shouchella lehensis]|uniref:N-acetyltransferase n=2 Tax=Shouchella lehensis TaxID=300825 RepID=A0A060LTD3_9BACI|nr:GNAT family N-acetyltransferase [Shouchella lehensis]AIC93392.1 N-acetyltransferase [Shouchella lehensis G1]MBG9782865.1 acetyltransferase [Shouchella lehensis]RQW22954.1 GNAT family N-acetyltransferase [Bacillus sp. C1-1]TES49788.1 GNAT family N-acetyltransferase [Shouchella lehensis]